jgi:hypothetical protein
MVCSRLVAALWMHSASPGGVDAVEAVGGPHARADRVLAAELDLAHDVRLGHVGARHADHVDQALAHRVPCGRDVVDLGGVQHGQPGLARTIPGEVEVGRGRHAVDRDHVGEFGVGVDAAADHVDDVDRPSPRDGAGSSSPVSVSMPTGSVSSTAIRIPRRSRVRPALGSPAAPPIGKRSGSRTTAPLVGAVVRRGRPELVEQVAVGLDLDAVHAARLHALGSVGVVPTMRSMSQPRPPSGCDRWAGSRIGDGASTGSQSSWPHPVRRPRWVIWIMHAAPCSCISSVIRRIQGTMSSSVGDAGCRTPVGCRAPPPPSRPSS